jgi:hypothetical protein
MQWLERLRHIRLVAWSLSILHSATVINWVFMMSILTGIGAAIWGFFSQWDWLSIALGALVAFGAMLWLINQAIWLLTRTRPLKSRTVYDYSHGLALDGLHTGKDETKPDAMFQVGLRLRNATAFPMKYDVEAIEVVLRDRTIRTPNFTNKGGTLPAHSATLFFYPPFTKAVMDELGTGCEGAVRYSIRYGHPDGDFIRCSKKDLHVSFRLDDKHSAVYIIRSESDEAIG